MGWVGTEPRAVGDSDPPQNHVALSEEKLWFHPSFGPCVSQVVLAKVLEHLHIPRPCQGWCLCNSGCCSSPVRLLMLPVMSPALPRHPGQQERTAWMALIFQDVSCGAPMLSSLSVLGGSCRA